MEFGWIHVYIGFAALVIILIVLWRQNKSLSYLLFFSIFWIYMMSVVSVVVFPVFVPDIPTEFSQKLKYLNFNIIPFNFGSCEIINLCIRDIYENILLTIPFGFGVSFILRRKPKNMIWLALAVGTLFETTQLVLLLVFGGGIHSADINDVIFNAIGVLLGYGIFKIFGWLYLFVTHRFNVQPKSIFAYIYNIITPHFNN
jgi:glycopeptide antibiotics resistance protein